MSEQQMAPKLRFNGFNDAWEQLKLGELGSVAMCKRIFKEQTTEKGDVPFFKIGTFGGKADAFISKELFEEYKKNYPYPTKGAILISASGSIGRTVEFNGKNEYFQDSNIVWLIHDVRLKDIFLKYLYEIVRWSGIEGTTIKRLYNDNILKTKISLPTASEQIQIGNFFQFLDNLIIFHEQKYEKVKLIKKSLLEKMFPREGANVPEIRFTGFTRDWVRYKLGEIVCFSRGQGLNWSDIDDVNGLYDCILYGNLYTDYDTIITEVIHKSKTKGRIVSKKQDVLIPASDTTPTGLARALCVLNEGIFLGGDINILSPIKDSGMFLAYALNHQKGELIKRVKGTTVRHLQKPDLEDLLISLPVQFEEQSKISTCLFKLDNLITLHQRKLEKLQNIKQSFLEKLFV